MQTLTETGIYVTELLITQYLHNLTGAKLNFPARPMQYQMSKDTLAGSFKSVTNFGY